jgi:hypothetical protein
LRPGDAGVGNEYIKTSVEFFHVFVDDCLNSLERCNVYLAGLAYDND